MSQGKIVLMACGSFSPPTFMHLRMFEIARDYIHSLGMGYVVGGIVSPVHDAYGKKDLVAAHHRISMLKLALKSSDWVKVSEWETEQQGWTRTRVTLSYHQETINRHYNAHHNSDPPAWLPDDVLNVNTDETDDVNRNGRGADDVTVGHGRGAEDVDVTVKLLCGADLLESFATPGLWSDDDLEAIVGRHGLVVVTRSGCDPGRFIYESDMLYKHRNNITLVSNYIVNEVSSTALRRLLRRRHSAKYLTEDAVIQYVRAHGLYGARPLVTEYYTNITEYDAKTPDDVTMTSPKDVSYKNIVITFRDKPSIIDETVLVKRQRKAKFLLPNSRTDSVSPFTEVKPKLAFTDKLPLNYIPGKAVKVTSDGSTSLQNDKVSEYNSLDSYLLKEADYELYKRRVSEGNVADMKPVEKEMKKRCSTSTMRKLSNKDHVKKSRSEVSKLCEKMKNVKLKDASGRNYKTRSCNDIVRLVMTKHGIHVISDTEAIV